ncbi:MAG: hypothetical protein MUP80_09985 [Acidobacteriia bacterium]|nr:hypothetical protein [Terriglobia bacterium]
MDQTDPLSTAGTEPEALGRASDEPFACPACGQMLAASCRVCVACKQPIDPSQIDTAVAESVRPAPAVALPAPEPVRFPWLLFLALFGIRLAVAMVAQRHFGLLRTELMLGGLEFVSAIWVFQDAQRRRVPKPLRWGLGSLLLWLLFFPWYLARRRAPEAPCPSIEAEISPVTRVLLIILVVFFLLGIVSIIFKGLPVTQ